MVKKIINATLYIVGSLLTTGIAVLLLSFGVDVFIQYGVTVSMVVHSISVIVIMVFMLYVIYNTWNQTWHAIRPK